MRTNQECSFSCRSKCLRQTFFPGRKQDTITILDSYIMAYIGEYRFKPLIKTYFVRLNMFNVNVNINVKTLNYVNVNVNNSMKMMKLMTTTYTSQIGFSNSVQFDQSKIHKIPFKRY